MQDQPTADPISQWLDQIQIAGTDNKQPYDIHEAERLEGDGVCRTKTPPVTPIRKPQLTHPHAGISPTDTNFSDDKIFDSPLSLRVPAPFGSSNPLLNDDYTDTDVSSVGETDDDDDRGKSGNNNNYEVPPSLKSYDPLSSVATLPQAAIADQAPSKPPLSTSNLVYLVSCLQCVTKGLPCSRTAPACHRCIRNGHGDVCLLQRRLTIDEMFEVEGVYNRTPMLLNFKEETELVRAQKMVLREELLEEWKGKEDRRNWVYPAMSERNRVAWRAHPGEGKGKIAFMAAKDLG